MKKQITNAGFRRKYTPGDVVALRSVQGNLQGFGTDSYRNGFLAVRLSEASRTRRPASGLSRDFITRVAGRLRITRASS